MNTRIIKKLILGISMILSSRSFCASTPSSSDSSSTMKSLERPMNLTKTKDLGLGLKWGALTGLSLKYWASETEAWDYTAAFSDNNTTIGVDYIIHFREATADLLDDRFAKNIAPYIGGGLLASFGGSKSNVELFNHDKSEINTAFRIPIGLEYLPTNVRLGLFAELGLGLGIAPKTYTFATADIGGRFYF